MIDGEILYETLYCGINHSDVIFANNDIGITSYPIVPGCEIVGRIVEVSSKKRRVRKFLLEKFSKLSNYQKDLEDKE